MRIAFDTLFSTETNLLTIKAFFDRLDIDFELTPSAGEGISIEPLHLISLRKEDSKRIFALIPVNERRNFLMIRNDSVDKQDRIGLKKNARVKIGPLFVARKLGSLRPDIEFVPAERGEILQGLNESVTTAAVIEGCFVTKEMRDNYKVLPLDEREFGHVSGQGYFAIVGEKDHDLGKVFRKLNTHDDISICNVERKLAQMSDNLINCHCEIDRSANIHLWVFDANRETHISQSTRSKIEERALKELQA
jgi:hypothetical protein